MRRAIVVLVVVAGCAGGGDGPVPQPRAAGPLGLATHDVPGLAADSAGPVDVVWDDAAGRPRLVIGAFGAPGDPEAVARAVLARHADVFQLDPTGADLAVAAIRHGRAGTYVRFGERIGDLPVFDGEVIALVVDGAVRTINLAHRGPVAAPDLAGDIGAGAALTAMYAALGSVTELAPPTIERGIAIDHGAARLAYRITVPAAVPRGSWRAVVDGRTGALSGLHDLRVLASGVGKVFDPNAVDATGDVALVDGNDADTAALTAALVPVTLERLDGSGFLRGTWADARSTATRATEPGLLFDYTRSDDRFEEVMAYFHLDRAQQRIQDLGIPDANAHPQVAVVNSIPDDNSFYDPSTHEIQYGSGGVDDAEDADIVLHEYGHAIQHDQVLNWGNGDEGAMGEGFGDYLGGGFATTLATAAGRPGMIDPACVGEWDATSYSGEDPPCLRRLDAAKHYPESATGEPHDDGEMWSSALWRARTEVGADVVDALVVEHHFMLSDTETFDTAAAALLATDVTMNSGANTVALRHALYAWGVLRTPVPEEAGQVVGHMDVSVDNPRVGGLYANDLDDSQTISAGGNSVRVHFTMIDTEEDTAASCLGGCDNIYLFSDGDLYQILHGQAADVTSVAMRSPVVIRLVTDGSVQKVGYHVDRIDLVGVPGMDARSPDAAGNPEDGDGGGCCQGSAGGSIPVALLAFAALVRRRRTA